MVAGDPTPGGLEGYLRKGSSATPLKRAAASERLRDQSLLAIRRPRKKAKAIPKIPPKKQPERPVAKKRPTFCVLLLSSTIPGTPWCPS
jgi:hypothetical protein